MDQQIFRVYTTVLEMLSDRGYEIPERYKFENVVDLEKKYKNRDNIEIVVSKGGDILSVSFFHDLKPTVKDINERIKKLKEKNIKNAIFVVRDSSSISPMAHKTINKSDMITLFNEKELSFNITKHILVPPHKLLSEEEKQQVLEKFKTTPENMPKILLSDPVSKYYNFQEGDLIEITRISESAGVYTHYKIVEKD